MSPGLVRTYVAAWLVYAATASGILTSTDAVIQYDLTREMIEQRSLALPSTSLASNLTAGTDRRQYSQFGIGQSLYNVPFYLAGRAVERAAMRWVRKPEMIRKAVVALGNTVAAAGVVALTFLFAWRLTRHVPSARFTALAVAFGTALWPYSKFGFNAPLATWLLLSAVYCAWVGGRERNHVWLAIAGMALGAGWLVRHEFIIAAIPIGLWLAFDGVTAHRERISRLAAFAPGIVLAGVLWSGYNFVRFGDPLYTGYTTAFSGKGYFGLLFSPGGSLFLYSPIVLVGISAIRRFGVRDPSLARLIAGVCLTLFMFFGALDDWPGGRSYGARYLVPLLPLLCLPLSVLWMDGRLRTRRWLSAALVASVLIQIPGIAVDYAVVSQRFAAQATAAERAERNYRWRSSALVLNTIAAWRAAPANLRYVSGVESPPSVKASSGPDDHSFSEQFGFSLDFWWLYLFYLRLVPAFAAVLAGGLLLTAGIALW